MARGTEIDGRPALAGETPYAEITLLRTGATVHGPIGTRGTRTDREPITSLEGHLFLAWLVLDGTVTSGTGRLRAQGTSFGFVAAGRPGEDYPSSLASCTATDTSLGSRAPVRSREMKTPLALVASLVASLAVARRRGWRSPRREGESRREPLRRRRRRRVPTGDRTRGRGPDRGDRPRGIGVGRRRVWSRSRRSSPASSRAASPPPTSKSTWPRSRGSSPERAPGRRTCAAWPARARTCGSSAGRSAGTPVRASSQLPAERVETVRTPEGLREPVARRGRARAAQPGRARAGLGHRRPRRSSPRPSASA